MSAASIGCGGSKSSKKRICDGNGRLSNDFKRFRKVELDITFNVHAHHDDSFRSRGSTHDHRVNCTGQVWNWGPAV